MLKARRPKVERTPKRVLSLLGEVHRLLAAAAGHPLGAAVGLLFGCGLRVSEALAVGWDDVDLDGGKLTIRRAATYSQAYGLTLGPPKNRGAQGVVMLPATVVALLRGRRVRQAEERLAAGPVWEIVEHGGRPVDLVFTTLSGGLVGRQRLTKVLGTIAVAAGIDPTGLGTHVGRRSLVTALHSAGLDLGDISRHVGHASASTTAGYVAHLADRPETTGRAAAALVDGR